MPSCWDPPALPSTQASPWKAAFMRKHRIEINWRVKPIRLPKVPHKVWNAETGHSVHTHYGHTSTVGCMQFDGKKVASGSRDVTLRVQEIESGECLHELVGHPVAVRCVECDGRLVVSGAYDYMVKDWDPGREECLNDVGNRVRKLGRKAKPKVVHLNRLVPYQGMVDVGDRHP